MLRWQLKKDTASYAKYHSLFNDYLSKRKLNVSFPECTILVNAGTLKIYTNSVRNCGSEQNIS